MNYEKPAVVDFGDLVELTRASGIIGSPDGVGFTLQVNVGPIGVSAGVLP
jgi:hypothetical protein